MSGFKSWAAASSSIPSSVEMEMFNKWNTMREIRRSIQLPQNFWRIPQTMDDQKQEEFLDAMQEWQKRTPPGLESMKASPERFGQILNSLAEMLIRQNYKSSSQPLVESSDSHSEDDSDGRDKTETAAVPNKAESGSLASALTNDNQEPFDVAAVQSIMQVYGTLLASSADQAQAGRREINETSAPSIPTIVGMLSSILSAGHQVPERVANLRGLVHSLVTVDVCTMLGFKTAADSKPYCGLTNGAAEAIMCLPAILCDIKMLPFSIRYFLKENEKYGKVSLDPGRKMCVTLSDGSKTPIMDATAWELYNLHTDEVVSLPARLAKACKAKSCGELWAAVSAYSPKSIGWAEIIESIFIHDKSMAPNKGPLLIGSVLLNPEWKKAMGRSGIGSGKLCLVELDSTGRMSVEKLKNRLEACLAAKIPILAVVVTVGSLVLGTVDALNEILLLRAVYQKKGLHFNVHVDATNGGHFISTIRKDYDLLDNYEPPGRGFFQRSFGKLLQGNSDDHFTSDVRNSGLSDFVVSQLRKVQDADSVTLDLASLGTTGGVYLCRHPEVRLLVRSAADGTVNGSSAAELEELLEETLEGSTISQAELYGAFMHFRFIKPTLDGAGRLLAKANLMNKVFLIQLLQLGFENKAYDVVPLIPCFRLNLDGTFEEDQKELFKIPAKYVDGGSSGLAGHPKALSQLRTAGPDLAKMVFAFNLKNPKSGAKNVKWSLFQKFNEAIYDSFQKAPGEKPRRLSMAAKSLEEPLTPGGMLVKNLGLVRLNSSKLGDTFMESLADRLGLHSGTAPSHQISELVVFQCEGVFSERSVSENCDNQATVLEALERIDQAVKTVCSTFKNEKM